MKKSNLILVFICALFFSRTSMAFATAVSGPSIFCPGTSNNVPYYADISTLGTITKIVWTCGGAGSFTANNSQSYTVYTNVNNDTQWINWSGSNGTSSWVQVTFYYTIFRANYTSSAVETVYFGIQGGSPTSISYTAKPCINSTTPIQVTCPTPLPTIPSGCSYYWYTNNGSISGTGQTVTLTPGANSNNIVVTVWFYNPNCNSYSTGYSVTIPRTTSVPAVPTNAWFDIVLNDGIHCFNHAFVETVTGATSYVWTQPSSQETIGNENSANLIGGRTYNIAVKSKNTCGLSISAYSYTGPTLTCSPPQSAMNNSRVGSNLETKELSIYPNPANTSFEISIPDNESSARIVMTNIAGQVIKDFTTNESKTVIESSNIPAGLYILNISSDNINTVSKIQIVK